MEQYIIKGGNPLVGDVTISGAKNAALGILAAFYNILFHYTPLLLIQSLQQILLMGLKNSLKLRSQFIYIH